jgi:hypothetical protein
MFEPKSIEDTRDVGEFPVVEEQDSVGLRHFDDPRVWTQRAYLCVRPMGPFAKGNQLEFLG